MKLIQRVPGRRATWVMDEPTGEPAPILHKTPPPSEAIEVSTADAARLNQHPLYHGRVVCVPAAMMVERGSMSSFGGLYCNHSIGEANHILDWHRELCEDRGGRAERSLLRLQVQPGDRFALDEDALGWGDWDMDWAEGLLANMQLPPTIRTWMERDAAVLAGLYMQDHEKTWRRAKPIVAAMTGRWARPVLHRYRGGIGTPSWRIWSAR